jgi:hypothetical protein
MTLSRKAKSRAYSPAFKIFGKNQFMLLLSRLQLLLLQRVLYLQRL